MIEVVLSLGSNCGDKLTNIYTALNWLSGLLENIVSSTIYETPCARMSDCTYMNAVVRGLYRHDTRQLDILLKQYEIEAGRTAERREKGEVPVDLDIVIADGEIIKEWDFRQKFFKTGYDQLK